MEATSKKELTLHPSRFGYGLLLLCSAGMTVLAAFMLDEAIALRSGGRAATGVVGIAFFGLGTLTFLCMLIPNWAYLHVDGEGFRFRHLLRSFRYRWAQTTVFRVRHFLLVKSVVFHFRLVLADTPPEEMADRGPCRLPSNYGMRAQDLADLMNQWRDNALAAEQETQSREPDESTGQG